MRAPRRHPSPYAYRTRAVLDDPSVVGWFMVAFKTDPNHEYPFKLLVNGSVLPELDLIEVTPVDRQLFARYLASPDFDHVTFHQQTPVSPEERDSWTDGKSPV